MTIKRRYVRKPDVIFHIWNRGARQGHLFYSAREYEKFMELLVEALKSIHVSLIAYVLLPDQFELILHQQKPYAASRFLLRVCHQYSLWLNQRRATKGTNFEGQYKAVPLEDAEQTLRVSCRIYRSPVEAGLASSPEAWPYSSYGRCIDPMNGRQNGQALLLDLVGGPGAYENFVKHFVAADPDSVKQFLCPEFATVWVERGQKSLRERKI